MNYKIKEINSEDTLPIRHQVMWPNKPLEYVKLSRDKEGKHYGLFIDEKLISVISFFETAITEVQFRKFATLKQYQGNGYGTLLLNFIIELINNGSIHKIWCNARADKTSYYHKFGLKTTDKLFIKGGVYYVIMEKNL